MFELYIANKTLPTPDLLRQEYWYIYIERDNEVDSYWKKWTIQEYYKVYDYRNE